GPGGGGDSERNGDHEREQDGENTEGERGGEALEHQVEHRPLVSERGAEVALNEAGEKDPELLENRAIGAELLTDSLDDLLAASRRHHEPRRIARHQAEHEESDADDAEDDEQRLHPAAEEEARRASSA